MVCSPLEPREACPWGNPLDHSALALCPPSDQPAVQGPKPLQTRPLVTPLLLTAKAPQAGAHPGSSGIYAPSVSQLCAENWKAGEQALPIPDWAGGRGGGPQTIPTARPAKAGLPQVLNLQGPPLGEGPGEGEETDSCVGNVSTASFVCISCCDEKSQNKRDGTGWDGFQS